MSSDMVVRMERKARVVVTYGGFEIATDQPVEAGGEGSAPEPYALFLASIAACAGFYVMRFCQARQIPTDGVRIRQRLLRDSGNPVTTGRLELDIEVPPDFPEKYHEAVVRAADTCAVKKTLQAPFDIRVQTVVRS